MNARAGQRAEATGQGQYRRSWEIRELMNSLES